MRLIDRAANAVAVDTGIHQQVARSCNPRVLATNFVTIRA